MKPTKRSGFTLLEVLTTLTIGSVVFGLAVVTLAQLLRASSAAQRHLQATQSIARLSEQFRDDAGRATSLKLSANPSSVEHTSKSEFSDEEDSAGPAHRAEDKELPAKTHGDVLTFEQSPQRRVEYATSSRGIDRTAFQGDAVVERDTFFLEGKNVRIEIHPNDVPPRAAAIIGEASLVDGDGEGAARAQIRVEAFLGVDRGFDRDLQPVSKDEDHSR